MDSTKSSSGCAHCGGRGGHVPGCLEEGCSSVVAVVVTSLRVLPLCTGQNILKPSRDMLHLCGRRNLSHVLHAECLRTLSCCSLGFAGDVQGLVLNAET